MLTKNPQYWEADSVLTEEIVFLPLSNGTTNVNLYRAGVTQSMNPRLIPPLLAPALANKKDFSTSPAFRTIWYSLDTKKPPLDRPLVRYALNLAIDKAAITRFLAAGQKPAYGVVPPMAGYPSLPALSVPIGGRQLNILGFDPRTARELLDREDMAGLELSMKIPARPRSRDIAPIIQRHWLQHLDIQVSLSEVEQTVWEQDLTFKRYGHVIEESWSAFCEDPSDFLHFFGPSRFAATTWTDAGFDRDFVAANRLPDPAERIKALAACEAQLIKAMPVIPIFHDSWAYLEAPFLRGVPPNPFGLPRFKYASIDTNWRPA